MPCKIEITNCSIADENGVQATVYGIKIKGGAKTLEYPDLCTNKERLDRLCSVLGDEMPNERLLCELFEDYLF